MMRVSIFSATVLCIALLTQCEKPQSSQDKPTEISPQSGARKPTEAKVETEQKRLAPQTPVKTETLPKPIQEAVAAAEKEKEGPNACDQAFRGLSAAMEKLRQSSAQGIPKSMPKYEVFMEHCENLPEGAQKCLVLPYALAHQAECRQEQDKLDDATKQKLQTLLQGETPSS